MKNTKSTLFFLIICFVCNAQTSLVKQWDKRYGGISIEQLFDFQQTTDGGYILGGYSVSDSSGDKTQNRYGVSYSDFWVVKVDSAGDKQWDKRYGGIGRDELYGLRQTKDGGYILAGNSDSPVSGDKTQPSWDNFPLSTDWWMIKIDSLGNKQWDKRFGGTAFDFLEDVLATKDGGYMLCGLSSSNAGGDKTQSSRGLFDAWLVKTDSLGNKEWDRRFGGSDNDEVVEIVETDGGSFIVAGNTTSDSAYDVSQPNRGVMNDYWLLKVDKNGNKLWDKRFGGASDESLESVKRTSDGGFILGGISNSGVGGDKTQPRWGGLDYWMVKTDSAGNKLWDRRLGSSESEEYFGSIAVTSDNGFLLCGSSGAIADGDKTEPGFNTTGGQAWVVKTDSAGNKVWDKTILTDASEDLQSLAIQTADGCYAIAFYTRAGVGGHKTEANRDTTEVTSDYWMVKFCPQQCNIPTITIAVTGLVFCEGDSLLLCAPAGYSSYTWSNGYQTTCINANAGGNYAVTVSDNSNCSAVSDSVALNMIQAVEATITVNGNLLTASQAIHYQWYVNGNIIAGATESTYQVVSDGVYTVELTDAYGCSKVSDPVVFTSIAEGNEAESYIRVYPNPVENELYITCERAKITDIQLLNTSGNILPVVEHNGKFDVSALPAGIYFVNVLSGDFIYHKKFLKL